MGLRYIAFFILLSLNLAMVVLYGNTHPFHSIYHEGLIITTIVLDISLMALIVSIWLIPVLDWINERW